MGGSACAAEKMSIRLDALINILRVVHHPQSKYSCRLLRLDLLLFCLSLGFTFKATQCDCEQHKQGVT